MLNIQDLLDKVIEMNASDLHFGVGMQPAIRADGELKPVEGTDIATKEDLEAAFRSVVDPDPKKAKDKYEKFERTNELDFSFSHVTKKGVEARFRGNLFQEMKGPAGAFRLIPMKIRTLQDLVLPDVLSQVANKRRGLFLVTGPTGHGKSTTLAAIIHEINKTRYDHIMTIEDPIEFVHKPLNCVVHQREIGTDTESFQEALKHVLRQDPDIILIGELRDLETIAAAITAAETGHLVFGTLHTQDASQSVDRLIDVFPPHQQMQIRIQLASVLVGICSQQLVPKPGGGRVCATEILMATPAVRNCIREAKTSQIRTAIQTGASVGMHTMEQCLAECVANRRLSQETAAAYAYDVKELQRLLSSMPGVGASGNRGMGGMMGMKGF